jgi:hypothetical protein
MTLVELRVDCEKGLMPLSVIDQSHLGKVSVIFKGILPHLYICHRYFKINEDWAFCDKQENISVEKLISLLSDPIVQLPKKKKKRR